MSHNNLSKTVVAVIFSLTIASALPVLAQSGKTSPQSNQNTSKPAARERLKPVDYFPKTSVKTTQTTVKAVTVDNFKGQGSMTGSLDIRPNPIITGSGSATAQGELGKTQIYTTESCKQVRVKQTNNYVQYKKKDGTTFNMDQGPISKVLSDVTIPGPCPSK